MLTSSTPDTKQRIPRYRVAEQKIIQRIQDGIYQAGQRLESVDTLAADLKVSPSTLRQSLQSLAAQGVLNCVPGRGTSVSKNVAGILTPPSASANTGKMYSLIMPDIRYIEFSTIAHSIQELLRDQDIELGIYSTEDDPGRYQQEVDRAIRNGSKGIILAPPLNETLPIEALLRLKQSGIPVVSCYRPIEALAVPSIRQDIFSIHKEAARYLIQTGCSRIGLMHIEAIAAIDIQFFREGLHGHKHAIMEHQLNFNDELVLSLEAAGNTYQEWAACYTQVTEAGQSPPHEHRVQRTMHWLEKNPQIDAVVCYNDYLAPILTEALARLGRSCPEDVSIIARGSVGFQMYTPKPVSMMDVNLAEFGKRAYELLQRIAAGEQFKAGYYETVAPTLIPRGTTKAIPHNQ